MRERLYKTNNILVSLTIIIMVKQKTVKVGNGVFIRLQSKWAREHEIEKGSLVNVRELKSGNLIVEVLE